MGYIYINKIEAFQSYSNFTSLKDFNNQIEMFLAIHKEEFTPRELILFKRLTKYCAKVFGVSNASIRTILTAAKERDLNGESVSESTFHRMKRKAVKLGILESIETKRLNHSQSSNLWIFKRFTDSSNNSDTPGCKEEEQKMLPQQCLEEKRMTPLETNNIIKTNMLLTSTATEEKNKNADDLDYTFVPHDVDQKFIETVRPFYDKAQDIYALWQLTLTAYQEAELNMPIQKLQETIRHAFKTAVFYKKQRKIKKTFKGYFYAVLKDHFNVVFRQHLFQHHDLYFDWR